MTERGRNPESLSSAFEQNPENKEEIPQNVQVCELDNGVRVRVVYESHNMTKQNQVHLPTESGKHTESEIGNRIQALFIEHIQGPADTDLAKFSPQELERKFEQLITDPSMILAELKYNYLDPQSYAYIIHNKVPVYVADIQDPFLNYTKAFKDADSKMTSEKLRAVAGLMLGFYFGVRYIQSGEIAEVDQKNTSSGRVRRAQAAKKQVSRRSALKGMAALGFTTFGIANSSYLISDGVIPKVQGVRTLGQPGQYTEAERSIIDIFENGKPEKLLIIHLRDLIWAYKMKYFMEKNPQVKDFSVITGLKHFGLADVALKKTPEELEEEIRKTIDIVGDKIDGKIYADSLLKLTVGEGMDVKVSHQHVPGLEFLQNYFDKKEDAKRKAKISKQPKGV